MRLRARSGSARHGRACRRGRRAHESSVDLWFAQNATWRLLERLPELRRRSKAVMRGRNSSSRSRAARAHAAPRSTGMTDQVDPKSFADLAADTAVTADPDVAGRYHLTLPDHWDYLLPSGGVVMTAALRAAEAHLGDPTLGSPRATTIFASPIHPGKCIADVHVIRRGGSAAQVRVDLAPPAGEGRRAGPRASSRRSCASARART